VKYRVYVFDHMYGELRYAATYDSIDDALNALRHHMEKHHTVLVEVTEK